MSGMSRKSIDQENIHYPNGAGSFFLRIPKECACGCTWYLIPEDHSEAPHALLPGFYWDCSCGSTLVAPYDNIEWYSQ